MPFATLNVPNGTFMTRAAGRRATSGRPRTVTKAPLGTLNAPNGTFTTRAAGRGTTSGQPRTARKVPFTTLNVLNGTFMAQEVGEPPGSRIEQVVEVLVEGGELAGGVGPFGVEQGGHDQAVGQGEQPQRL